MRKNDKRTEYTDTEPETVAAQGLLSLGQSELQRSTSSSQSGQLENSSQSGQLENSEVYRPFSQGE
jgi:hypothetical protein